MFSEENNFIIFNPNNTLYRASPFVNVGRGYSNGYLRNKVPISWFSTSQNDARVYLPIQEHLSKTIIPVVRKYNITKNNGIRLLRLDKPSVINKLRAEGVNLSRSFEVKNNKVLRVKRSKQLKSNLVSAQRLGDFIKKYRIPAHGWYHNKLQIVGNMPSNSQNAELALFDPNVFVSAKSIDPPPSGAIYKWNHNQPRKVINNNTKNNNNRNRSPRPSPVKRRRLGGLFGSNIANNNNANNNRGSHMFGGISPRASSTKVKRRTARKT